jgi:hypothetical protein
MKEKKLKEKLGTLINKLLKERYNLNSKISDEECKTVNQILKESKVQILDLSGIIIFFNKKDNKLTKKGLEYLKETLMNHEYLKEINLSGRKYNKNRKHIL